MPALVAAAPRSTRRTGSAERRTQVKTPGSAVVDFETKPVHISQQEMSKATILSSQDLFMLTRAAYAKESTANPEATRREDLRKKSEDRHKNWGNTLEAARQKKIKAREKRLADQELAQQELDRQEAIHADKRRRQCIERANNILFQQQDRTKEFHSAMDYSRTLQARMSQIQFSRAVSEQKEHMEQMWHAQEMEQLNRAIEREEREAASRKAKSLDIAKQQLRQLKICQERMKAERQRDFEQGLRMKALADEALREAEAVEEAKREILRQNNEGYVRANIEQQKIKAQIAMAEKMEEEKILEYARKKERLDQMRKEHEAKIFNEKQARYQKMIDNQTAKLAKVKADEEARQAKMEAALEAAGKEREERESQYTDLRKKQIARSREEQIAEKRREQEMQEFEDAIWVQEGLRRTVQMQQESINKDKRIIEKNLKHAAFLKQQAKEARARKRMEKIDDLEAAYQAKMKIEEEDEVYRRYAEESMEAYAARGRSIVPMKLTLAKQVKRETRLHVE